MGAHRGYRWGGRFVLDAAEAITKQWGGGGGTERPPQLLRRCQQEAELRASSWQNRRLHRSKSALSWGRLCRGRRRKGLGESGPTHPQPVVRRRPLKGQSRP